MTGYHCSGCGEVFRSLSAFDLHRIGSFATHGSTSRGARRCMSHAEMAAKGLTCDEKRGWKHEGASPFTLRKKSA